MRYFILIGLIITGMSHTWQNETFRPMKDVAAFKTSMQAANAKVMTVKCDFVQEKHLSFLSDKIISKGKMKYKKPDMLMLEYAEPYVYIMSLYKGKVVIKDNGKISKFDTKSNKLFKYINDLMINSVQGNLFNQADFSYVYKESDLLYLVEMTPVPADFKEYIAKVKIYADKKDFMVRKIEINEPGGDYTLINFTNRILNTTITDAEFLVK